MSTWFFYNCDFTQRFSVVEYIIVLFFSFSERYLLQRNNNGSQICVICFTVILWWIIRNQVFFISTSDIFATNNLILYNIIHHQIQNNVKSIWFFSFSPRWYCQTGWQASVLIILVHCATGFVCIINIIKKMKIKIQ